MVTVTRYTIHPASSVPGHGPTCEEKGSIQYRGYDPKAGRTVFGVRWIWAVPRTTTDGFTDFPGTAGKRKTILNLISELPFDILKMIYHLVLEKEHGVLLLRLGHHRLSTAYALGLVCWMPNGTTWTKPTWRE